MNEDVIEAMSNHSDPFLTLGDIADQMDVSKSAVYKRLQELEEEGQIRRKDVGASAVVWWIPERDLAYGEA